MASTINAALTNGLIQTADTSGILQLQTVGTTALTIDGSQRVGIGVTPSGTYKLEVNGSISGLSVYSNGNDLLSLTQAAYAQSNTSYLTAIGSYQTILNDISNQFDGIKAVFTLRNEQANVTSSSITQSTNLEVILNGKKLTPYIKQNTTPWLTPYDSFKGFRVVPTSTDARVIIYNAPATGDQADITIINSSSTVRTRKYPYSATTIALGD